MKKIISVLLVLAMMLSFSVISFADDSDITLGEEYTVTVTGDEVLTYTFIPSESGMYKISAELLGDGDSDAVVYASSEGYSIYMNIYRYDSDSTMQEKDGLFVAKAGQEMTIELYNDFAFDEVEYENARVLFSITPASEIREITVGSSYDVDEDGEWFVLCPTEDAVYNIWSYDEGYATVEGSDGSSAWNKYYYDEIGFDFSFKVKAGEAYAVYVETECSTTINVGDGSVIAPSFIETENNVVMIRGTQEVYDVYVHPFGSNCNFETLVVEVSDNEIAEIEYDEELECLWITGKKAGKTTLKITEPVSGVSTEVEIEVVSEFSAIFIMMRDVMVIFITAIDSFFKNLINWF